jgi:metal-sulfur cluster biosynthetic enzyme
MVSPDIDGPAATAYDVPAMLSADTVREALRDVRDPELGFNILDLGLVYDVTVAPERNVTIRMTLTYPGCPFGATIEKDVKDRLRLLEGIGDITVTLTFTPPWSPAKVSEDLKREFALMGIPVTEEVASRPEST